MTIKQHIILTSVVALVGSILFRNVAFAAGAYLGMFIVLLLDWGVTRIQ